MRRRVVTVRTSDGRLICTRCFVADTATTRMRGLLGRRKLARDAGILLLPANAVHTFFMRFAIDVVFVDADFVVRRVVHGLRPWRAAGARGARGALELAAGAAGERGVCVGEQLVLDGS